MQFVADADIYMAWGVTETREGREEIK